MKFAIQQEDLQKALDVIANVVPAKTTLPILTCVLMEAKGGKLTLSATNLSPQRAPYAVGAHPYLLVGDAGIDGLELTLPAATRLLVDDRQLPAGREPVDGTDYDFRMPRPIRDTVFDHGFTDLTKDPAGGVTHIG